MVYQKTSYHLINKSQILKNILFESPKILWEEKASIFLRENSLPDIPGAWRLMLLGDGSPTRHLQLLTGKETKVKLIGMNVDQLSMPKAPEEINQLKKPLIRRQVWIENDEMTLAWAESWWNIDQVRLSLKNTKDPIWKNLTKDRSELFREVDSISIVDAEWIQQKFKYQGPFWSRNYRFFRNKKPLTIIREVFNPYIEKWIGDSGLNKFTKLKSTST
tara:strand:- start:1549 stop:2202 length:654 start_codon:yes stop_codon:yes gene_type:complete